MKIKVKFVDMPQGFDVYNNCYFRNLSRIGEVEISDEPQIVFYGPFGTEFLKYKECVFVFLADEPVVPNFNDCDYAIGSVDMTFGKRYFRHPPITGYGEISDVKILTQERTISQKLVQREFCNFIYSNEVNGQGAILRKKFCKRLSEYKKVDCPGRVLNNMEGVIENRYDRRVLGTNYFNDNWMTSKIAFQKKYKFTIAFENIQMDGWTTEKLIHPLFAYSVPIYWGNPNVSEFFNTKAFVNCNEFDDDFEKVINRVIELDKDDEQYLWILKQNPVQDRYDINWEDKLTEFFCYVVQNGKVEKNPMGFVSMSAVDYPTICREGKVGLRSIVSMNVGSVKGWIDYKLKRRKEL